MSGPDNKPNTPDDRELEDFLAGRGAVREAYRATALEKSPASVDNAILEMATQAVDQPAAPVVKPRRLRRWPMSLAAAAVLVLSLSVFVEIQRDPIAQKAVLAPVAMDAPQAPPVATPAGSQESAVASAQRAKARADAQTAQRSRGDLKKEMVEANAAGAVAPIPAQPAPKRSADRALQPMQEMESSAFSKAQTETGGDALRDQLKSAAPAPAPAMSAKSLRAAPADQVTMPAPAAAPAEEPSNATAFDQQIDHWLRTCAVDSGPALLPTDSRGRFKAAQQWHGLPVTGFADEALQFAPTVSRDAVVAQLQRIDPNGMACLAPASLVHPPQLRCGCLKP